MSCVCVKENIINLVLIVKGSPGQITKETLTISDF